MPPSPPPPSPPLHHHFLELVHPPRPLPLGEYDQYWYDAAQDHFLLLKGHMYRVLSLGAQKPSQPLYYDGTERDCLLAVFSLDKTLLAIQRNRYWVEVIDIHHSGREWWIDTRHGGSITASPPPTLLSPAEAGREGGQEGGQEEAPCSILPGGLLWSDHGGNSQDLLVLTERGLDMYKVSLKRQQCRLSRAFPHADTRFFLYHPAARLLLLATGTRGRELKGYFLRYESSASMPKFELPPPDRLPRFDLPSSSSSLNPLDLSLHRLYGSMFAAYVDTTAGTFSLFHLEKEQVSLFRSYSYFLPGGPVRLHSVDNLLLLHSVEGKVTMIYDILSSSAPSSPSSSLPASSSLEVPFCGGGPLAFSPYSSEAGKEGGKEGEAEDASVLPPIERFYDPRHFLFPSPDGGWVLEAGEEGGSRVWRLRVNLKAVAASEKRVPLLFPFLLRRGRVYPSLVRPTAAEEEKNQVEEDIGTQAHAVLLHEYHRRVAEGFPLFSTSLAPSLPPSLPSCPDGDDVSTMMRLCLSSSLHIPPPLSRSAYGSSGGGMTGARKGGKEVQRLAPEGDVCLAEEELIQQVFLPLVTAALATSSSPPSSPVPSPLYLSHVLLHHIGLLQTAIPSSLPPSLSPPQGIESGGKSAIVIPPTLVVILLRLLFHLQRVDRVIRFLRSQQGAIDSDKVANLLLAFLVEDKKEEGKEEELAYEKKELRQLVRDMLFRLRRMDLLVLQLLQEGRLVEALRTLRAMSLETKNKTTTSPSFPSLTEAPLLQALIGATNVRLKELSSCSPSSSSSLCPSSVPSSTPSAAASHRAAICYLLHEWLRSLDPKLFPLPHAASEKGEEGGGEARKEGEKQRFVDLVPEFPFDASHFSSSSVASTLAQQIYGYSSSGES